MPGWDDTFTAGLDDWLLRLEEAAAPALYIGTEVIKARSGLRAPLLEGHLEASGEVTVTGEGFTAVGRCRYPGPYARRQEFELTWRHPRKGQALYLTTTLYVDGGDAIRAIAEALRSVL